VVVDEPTRPGVAIEALDSTARARLRPSPVDGPSTPSPTVEVRMEGLTTPAPESRAGALTLEMPATDAAALSQSPASTGVGPSVPWEQEEPRPVATFAPTPKPAEPPRPTPPVAAPEEPRAPEPAAVAEPAVSEPARTSEVTRPDAPVPAPAPARHPSVPSMPAGSARPSVPVMPAASAPRPSVPSMPAIPAPRPSVPVMPAATAAPVPRAPEAAAPSPARVPEAFRPVAAPTVSPRAPEAVAPVPAPAPAPARVPEGFRPTVAAPTAPAPQPQARMPEPRPAPRTPEFNAAEVSRAYAATLQIPTVSGSDGPVESEGGERDGKTQNELPVLDAGELELPSLPQGLDETQPRYTRSAGSARHEDTLPRVVLEDAELQALRRDEEISSVVVGSGTRETTPATGRSKTARRSRLPPPDAAPAPRAQSAADTSPSQRALAPRSDTPESMPAIEPAHEEAPEAHEEEGASDAARSSRERMLLWAAIGALVLLVAVALVLVGLPALRARGARPVPAPVESAEPTPRRAAPSASPEVEAQASDEAVPTGPTAGKTVPAAGSEAAEVVAAGGAASEKQAPPAPAPSAEDDLLAPLEEPPVEQPPVVQAPVAPVRKPPVKTAKKVEPARAKQVRKPLTALQQEWRETQKTYKALTRITSCDNASLSILCDKYLDLEGDVLRAGDEEDAALLGKVKKMNEQLGRKLNVVKAASQ
jgi:serine/threonine-protein kinase